MMIEEKVKIVNKAGLHTRPAATIVKLASKYKSEFFISKDGINVNGKEYNWCYDTCCRNGF
jgi:phosphocarrier protein HPr